MWAVYRGFVCACPVQWIDDAEGVVCWEVVRLVGEFESSGEE